jgi:hypothetical protein
MRSFIALLLLLSLSGCISPTSTAAADQPNDREWTQLQADYQWLQTLRNAAPMPPAGATRKQIIEIRLETFRKVETTYNSFMGKLDDYYARTSDPRATQLMAREKVAMGDEYMNVLSRYDRAVDLYKAALQIDPQNADATRRLQEAESRRYVSMSAFATLKAGMKEDEVRRLLGLPREDWIKQVVQNGRVYSVWIYPKPDGGASAVYFDNGVVYHTNWNAAPAKN